MNYNSIPPQPPVTPYHLTEEYKETQSIKKDSNAISIGFLIYFSLTLITVPNILRIIKIFTVPYKNNPEFKGIDPVIYYLMFSILLITVLVPSFYISTLISKNNISNIIQFNKFDKKLCFAAIGVTMACFVYGDLASQSFLKNLNSLGIHSKIPKAPYDNNVLSIIMYAIGIAIVSPLVEEFVFRGVILGSLRKYGDGFAIIISSILFGFTSENLSQIPLAFIYGLALSFLTVRFNSILPAIIAHFLNNLFRVGLDIISYNSTEITSNIAKSVYFIALAVIGTICLAYVLKKDNRFFSISRSTSIFSLKKRIKIFLFSPAIILVLILMLILPLKTLI